MFVALKNFSNVPDKTGLTLSRECPYQCRKLL